ncbi:uncharacterized protein VTP21DRAFT_10701 [Calcarisporiella thermophila]|uniref:uncharacterized protein n=1 Tax=Calcarisporiella thermophila TaxID=911321 RepID=UPI003742EFD1
MKSTENIRRENRERKKRWREKNKERNKDNDLRARVNKRATTLFGREDSERKQRWIMEEFERRRSRRSLRGRKGEGEDEDGELDLLNGADIRNFGDGVGWGEESSVSTLVADRPEAEGANGYEMIPEAIEYADTFSAVNNERSEVETQVEGEGEGQYLSIPAILHHLSDMAALSERLAKASNTNEAAGEPEVDHGDGQSDAKGTLESTEKEQQGISYAERKSNSETKSLEVLPEALSTGATNGNSPSVPSQETETNRLAEENPKESRRPRREKRRSDGVENPKTKSQKPGGSGESMDAVISLMKLNGNGWSKE